MMNQGEFCASFSWRTCFFILSGAFSGKVVSLFNLSDYMDGLNTIS
jgi:hypothetical protein